MLQKNENKKQKNPKNKQTNKNRPATGFGL